MEEKAPSVADVSISDYVDMLRRRKGIIIQTFLLVFLVGTVVTFLSKPVYRATARILVEGKSFTLSNVNTSDPLNSIMQPDSSHDVGTQIEILQGANVLAGAYQQASVPPGAIKLEVKQVSGTDVIELVVDSNNATYAHAFAAQLPSTFRDFLTGNRTTELKQALSFSQTRLDQEKLKHAVALERLRKLRNTTDIYRVEVERAAALTEKNTADTSLQSVQADLAIARTRMADLSRSYRSMSDNSKAVTNTTNPEIALLHTRIADLKTQRTSLLVLYKPAHVKVREVDTEISDLEKRLAAAPKYIATTVEAANSTRQALAQQIREVQTQIATSNTALAQANLRVAKAANRLRALGNVEPTQEQYESQVDTAKASIASLTKTVEDLQLKEKGLHNPITVVAPASAAVQVEPKKVTNIVFSAVVGLLLGFGLALLLEFLDDRVSSTEEAHRLIGVPTLGYIPVIEEPDVRLLTSKNERSVGSYSGNSVLESYRLLRTNLQFSNVDRPIESLMVTSALPGEGKSITAINLATAFAMAGRRVLIIDADLRRPSLHNKLAVAKHPGLTNVLLGTATIEDAIQDTGVNNMRVLTSGLLPPNPAELFGSNAMMCLHEDLRAQADIIIWDTPPILAAADAQVLSASVDGVLFVVQHGSTRKSALRHATAVLKQARANILGVMFNRVDPAGKRDENYYSYYQYYQSYAAEPDKLAKLETRRQFEALVSGGVSAIHRDPDHGKGNGNGNGADTHDDSDYGVVAASPSVEKSGSSPQNPMERTIVLPARPVTPPSTPNEDK